VLEAQRSGRDVDPTGVVPPENGRRSDRRRDRDQAEAPDLERPLAAVEEAAEARTAAGLGDGPGNDRRLLEALDLVAASLGDGHSQIRHAGEVQLERWGAAEVGEADAFPTERGLDLGHLEG
jgi:hypothetical protein